MADGPSTVSLDRCNRRPVRRRDVLRLLGGSVAASAAGAGLGVFARGARAQPPIAVVPLRDRLLQITGAGGNVVMLAAADGTVLVDSGAPEHAAALTEAVGKHVAGAPVELLLNTHWHLEHTGGNDGFGAAGAAIVAHENTKLWMSTQHYVDWEDRTYEPRSPAGRPNRTFYSHEPQPRRAEIGEEPIEYGHLREAHTDGDIYVFFPRRNVLVTGGAVTVGAYPVPDYATGGWIGGLEEATRTLLALVDAETLIVPASGPAQRRPHLQAQHDMVTAVRGRIENLMRQGRSAEEMLAAGVTREFDGVWKADRERFVRNVYNGLWWQGRLDGSL